MAGRGKHLPAAERKSVIVQTVLDLAAEGDPSRITTVEIAKRMNLTQGALFRHFPSKDALWEEVMAWVSEQILLRLQDAAGGKSSPIGALEDVFFAHMGFAAGHPGAPRILFSELLRGEESGATKRVRSFMTRYIRLIAGMIGEGKRVGEVDHGVDEAAAGALFMGLIQGLVLQSALSGNWGSVPGEGAEAFAIFRRGIERGKNP